MDTYGKKTVETICRLEKDRVEQIKADNKIVWGDRNRSERYIPHYFTPSAAGYSVPLDGEDFEMVLVDDNVPKEADFAVTIQGQSMLPYIHDGEIVYVKRNTELEIGDVGIFSVDGAMYCKQYYLDSERNLILVSANPEYKDANVFVSANSSSNVKCHGRVLLKHKIALPDYFNV